MESPSRQGPSSFRVPQSFHTSPSQPPVGFQPSPQDLAERSWHLESANQTLSGVEVSPSLHSHCFCHSPTPQRHLSPCLSLWDISIIWAAHHLWAMNGDVLWQAVESEPLNLLQQPWKLSLTQSSPDVNSQALYVGHWLQSSFRLPLGWWCLRMTTCPVCHDV